MDPNFTRLTEDNRRCLLKKGAVVSRLSIWSDRRFEYVDPTGAVVAWESFTEEGVVFQVERHPVGIRRRIASHAA